MTILALDLASQVGWAVAVPPYALSPTPLEHQAGIPSPVRESGSKGFGYLKADYAKMMGKFHGWLFDQVTEHQPTMIVYEAVLPFQPNPDVARIALGMAAITEMTAYEMKRRPFHVHNARLKKFATGKGNAKKPMMMQAGRERGWLFTDDNECDALWLAEYGCYCMTAKMG